MSKTVLQLINHSGRIVTLKQFDDKNFDTLGYLDNGDRFRFATKSDAMKMLTFCEAYIRRDDILQFTQPKDYSEA